MGAIVCDLCGTLSNNTHRLHLAPSNPESCEEASWQAFMAPELVEQDGTRDEVWLVVRAVAEDVERLSRGSPLIFMTGRSEALRAVTTAWLYRHAKRFDMCRLVRHAPIMMRPFGDFRPSHEVKLSLLAEARYRGWNPTMAFEDRLKDARMFREQGLTVFAVAEALV